MFISIYFLFHSPVDCQIANPEIVDAKAATLSCELRDVGGFGLVASVPWASS